MSPHKSSTKIENDKHGSCKCVDENSAHIFNVSLDLDKTRPPNNVGEKLLVS